MYSLSIVKIVMLGTASSNGYTGEQLNNRSSFNHLDTLWALDTGFPRPERGMRFLSWQFYTFAPCLEIFRKIANQTLVNLYNLSC